MEHKFKNNLQGAIVLNTDYALTDEQIHFYRENGFIQLNEVITGEHLERFRTTVTHAVNSEADHDNNSNPKGSYEKIFIQKVNLWRRHPALKEFVLSKRFGNIAARLSGYQMRLWHDQALFKEPEIGAKTPWHQDTHYWPHREKAHQLSIWIALKDVTITNGCMSFIPGTQKYDSIPAVNLGNPQDLFEIAPQVKGIKPITCQLKAGSCTFHNGLTFHYAGPNRSDEMREAMVMIYMPDGTTYSGEDHVVIEKGEFQIGERLAEPKFPIVSDVPLKEIKILESSLQNTL
jgi:ectoine hydroxylase-related dioxygenase (phytanoyl-CoA dioxygenase family)